MTLVSVFLDKNDGEVYKAHLMMPTEVLTHPQINSPTLKLIRQHMKLTRTHSKSLRSEHFSCYKTKLTEN